jgi:peptidase S41-like protein
LVLSASQPPRITGFALLAIPPGDPPVLGYMIDAQTRDRVIDHAIAQLQDSYVSPELAKQMAESLRRHQKHGDYNTITEGDEFANLLTTHLRDVSHDKHLAVQFVPTRLPDSLDTPPDAQQLARNQRMIQRTNCGFDKVEVLPGNIGYVKFNGFFSPADCSQTAIAAMGFIANSDALIFDLRENGGGDPAMIALICSYLFDRPTHLNDLWNRKDNFSTQWWTLPYVPGKRLPNIPVYVLTSSRTFSGAEEFSYDLQSLKRATIVGEVTGGGAHPVRGQRIDDRFIIVVPIAKAINPITKTNWEGTGVKPDIAVAASDALTTAEKLASEKVTAQH